MSTDKKTENPSEINTEPKKPAKAAAAKAPAKKAVRKTAAKTAAADKPKAKKAPAKKAAARKTAVSDSYQSEQEAAVRTELIASEAKDGSEVFEAIEAIGKDDQAAAKKAAKKAPTKKAAAKKPAAKKTAARKTNESNQTAAQIEERTGLIASEAQAGAKVYRGIEEVKGAPYTDKIAPADAARKELAAKSAAQNNNQTNLSARSKIAAAAAVKGFKKPRKARKAKAAKTDFIQTSRPLSKDGQFLVAGIAEIAGTPYDAVIAMVEEEAADKARAQLAAKSAAENNAQTNLSARSKASLAFIEEESGQSETVMKEAIANIEAEANDGAKVFKAIEEVKGAPYSEKSPAMKAREELAAKSAAQNNTQRNLSARSEAAAAIAAKGFKKPSKAKKTNAVNQSKAQAAKAIKNIAAEANDGARVYRGIEAVEGTPYETVVENAKKAAAAKARTALARKARTVKGAAMKEDDGLKGAFYDTLDDNTLMEMAQAAGLDMDLETLKNELSRAASVAEKVEELTRQAAKENKALSFDEDGFDLSVVPYLCNRIAASLPNKAEDHAAFAKKIEKDIDRMLINDAFNDTAIYNDLMDDVRRVLVYGQQNGIENIKDMEAVIPTDLNKLIDRFMTVAYTILPGWQYRDVEYYQGFLYGVLSQFDDLAPLQNRAMMDTADLFILHGDYNRGNADYGYVLRENALKDQIYYRFANIYRGFDLQRAKGIAQEALRYIDGRYDYYPKIIEILQS